MPLHRSGSRRALLRKQFIILALVLCVGIVSAVVWQRMLRARQQGAALRVPATAGGETPEPMAGGVQVSDMVREVLTRARKTIPESAGRPSVFVIGEGGSADAIPLLEAIVEDKDENDLLRGDALHALFYLDEDRATSLAKRYRTQGSRLASIAERILARDPVMLERRDNVQRVSDRIP